MSNTDRSKYLQNAYRISCITATWIHCMLQTFFFHTLISFITLGSNPLCCTFYFTSKYLQVFISSDILWWSWRTAPNSFRWTSLPRSDNVHAQYIMEWITEREGERVRESDCSELFLLVVYTSAVKVINKANRDRDEGTVSPAGTCSAAC